MEMVWYHIASALLHGYGEVPYRQCSSTSRWRSAHRHNRHSSMAHMKQGSRAFDVSVGPDCRIIVPQQAFVVRDRVEGAGLGARKSLPSKSYLDGWWQRIVKNVSAFFLAASPDRLHCDLARSRSSKICNLLSKILIII